MIQLQKELNSIKQNLALIYAYINMANKSNENSESNIAENFFRDLLNKIFNLNLINKNAIKYNYASIDLIDETKKIMIQVTADTSSKKIRKTLEGVQKNEDLNGFSLKILQITEEKKNNINVNKLENNIQFDVKKDIYNLNTIYNFIKDLSFDKIQEIKNFIVKSVKFNDFTPVINSYLILTINVLSNLIEENNIDFIQMPAEIEEKIEYNNLNDIKDLISDAFSYNHLLNITYDTFNSEGKDKSKYVINKVKNIYRKNYMKFEDSIELFKVVINELLFFCKENWNYNEKEFYIEVIEDCLNIIVADTFIRCKIFKNPKED